MIKLSTLPVIGQEAVVPNFGLGRVTSFDRDNFIEVNPYIAAYPMKFNPKNVKLVKIIFEGGGELKSAHY